MVGELNKKKCPPIMQHLDPQFQKNFAISIISVYWDCSELCRFGEIHAYMQEVRYSNQFSCILNSIDCVKRILPF
jgi:hypothetical protein